MDSINQDNYNVFTLWIYQIKRERQKYIHIELARMIFEFHFKNRQFSCVSQFRWK